MRFNLATFILKLKYCAENFDMLAINNNEEYCKSSLYLQQFDQREYTEAPSQTPNNNQRIKKQTHTYEVKNYHIKTHNYEMKKGRKWLS